MKIINKKIVDLKHADYNPRELTKKQYEELKNSLIKYEFVQPVVVNIHPDRKNIIVGGHQRVRIAQELNIENIPCIEVNLPEDDEKELNIRLNKNQGQWDWDKLANHFDISHLTDCGFTENELLWKGSYEPTFENKKVTDDQFNAEEKKQEDKFRDMYKNNDVTLDLICPKCSHEFKVKKT